LIIEVGHGPEPADAGQAEMRFCGTVNDYASRFELLMSATACEQSV
jgi:hypothetical protein